MTRKINALFFIAVIFIGCAYVIYQLWHDKELTIPKNTSWLNGDTTQILDKRISHFAPNIPAADHIINGALYAFTGDADPQIRHGCGNWLFLTEEFVTTPNGEKNKQQRLLLIQSVIKELKAANISLISVPVPDKAEQQPAYLCHQTMSTQAKKRHDDWFNTTRLLPVIQVDLQQSGTLSYWMTDTHWDRQGAASAANTIAQQINPLIVNTPMQMEMTTPSAPHIRIGDLMKLARIDHNPPPFAPHPDEETKTQLTIQHEGGLLDDTPAPGIILAGSSYSLNSGFIDYLQYATKQEILQKSFVGSGFAGSLLNLIQNKTSLSDIHLIIWEWPLRALYQPLTDDELTYLREHGVQS